MYTPARLDVGHPRRIQRENLPDCSDHTGLTCAFAGSLLALGYAREHDTDWRRPERRQDPTNRDAGSSHGDAHSSHSHTGPANADAGPANGHAISA